jgi:hypothetical protein
MRKYFRRLIERLRAGVPGGQRGEPSIRDGSQEPQHTPASPQG